MFLYSLVLLGADVVGVKPKLKSADTQNQNLRKYVCYS